MVSPLQMRAMRLEIGKIAEAVGGSSPPTVNSIAALQKRMQPGDILVMTGAPPPKGKENTPVGLVNKLFGAASRKLQGGEYVHSAVYTGKGHITEIRGGEDMSRKPLKMGLKYLDAQVVRPNVAPRKRQQALKKLDKFVEEGATYDYKTLGAAAVAGPFGLKGKSYRSRINDNQLICSNMVSRAYSGVKFNKDKDPELMMPADFLRSHKVSPVATFHNPDRGAG
ncbi:MAG: hypothetical protein DRQ64_00145 [Gammaproteobacteria bacterium]|nr:MAG: hypothetical protein DRQ64_00145 [Gammaproteobacteria bacterium]